MKKLLVLAGGSKRNQAWGEGCVEHFRDYFDITCFVQYDHWETGQPNINFDTELEKVAMTAQHAGLPGDWYIMAKSIGSILALKAVYEDVIEPQACVFFGMPFSVVRDSDVVSDWSILKEFWPAALAFHTKDDPTAEYALTKDLLEKYAPHVTLKTLEGNTHDYLDFATYQEDVRTFLQI